jgi:hypothetical protein
MQSISNGSQYKAVRGDAVLVIPNILLISPCLKGKRFVFAASPSSCIERTPSVGFFLIFFENQPLEKSCDCRPAAPAGGDQIKQSRATFHNLSLGESGEFPSRSGYRVPPVLSPFVRIFH